MSTKNKKSINYGDIDLLDDEFEPKNVKVRITTLIDEDVLIKLKAFAGKRGTKYQTVLNLLLRSFFDRPVPARKVQELSEEKVRSIVREEIKKRA